MPVREVCGEVPYENRVISSGLGRIHLMTRKSQRPRLAGLLAPLEVGGTGLEPVTPSLSTRSSVRVSSLMFAQSASLSGISRRANT